MKKLSEIRKDFSLSRVEVAREAGLSVSAIGHYERGDRSPRLSTANLILKAIRKLTKGRAKCSIESLFPTTDE